MDSVIASRISTEWCSGSRASAGIVKYFGSNPVVSAIFPIFISPKTLAIK